MGIAFLQKRPTISEVLDHFRRESEPPAPPCSDDVVVESGAKAPKSCLSPLEIRITTAAGGLLPTSKISTATKTTFDHPTFWFCLTKEIKLGTLPQSSSYDSSSSGEIICLLPPPAGGSLKQNRGKIGCLIQAILKVVSAPARFGIVARVSLWRGSLFGAAGNDLQRFLEDQ